MSDKDGGPAFPGTSEKDPFYSPETGMSLRDYFAGQALVAVAHATMTDATAAKSAVGTGLQSEDAIALAAYRIAGAMLKERDKK